MASTARAMCGNSRRTANATRASSRFSTRSISIVDLRSRPRERGLRRSVLIEVNGISRERAFATRASSPYDYTEPLRGVTRGGGLCREIVTRELSGGGLRGGQAERFDNR